MGIGWGELLVILIVVLIVFGAGKLPSVMADLGKGVKAFKKGVQGAGDSLAVDEPKRVRKGSRRGK
jgi:sec-independent protein translocase protein TatA